MTTKLDLDQLAAKARSADNRLWFTVDPPWGGSDHVIAGNPDPHAAVPVADCQAVAEDDYGTTGGKDCENAAHIAANSPPVTLALCARIHELEVACRCGAVALRMHDNRSPTAVSLDEILEKGVVLP